jgi:hypothetical protein
MRCHVFYASKPHLPVKLGSGAAKCAMALDLAFWLRWASTLSRIRSSRPYLPAEVGYGATKCLMASNFASRLR